MMTFTELVSVNSADLPLDPLKAHLRLPDGFPDDASVAPRLEQSLRAALEAVEARTGKALYRRAFQWELSDWGLQDRVTIPIAPVVSLDDVTLLDPDAGGVGQPVGDFLVVTDIHKPALLPKGNRFPSLPKGGSVRLTLTAGFGANWSEVPSDLAEAVLILAAANFDAPEGALAAMSPAVEQLLRRYRGLSLGRIGG